MHTWFLCRVHAECWSIHALGDSIPPIYSIPRSPHLSTEIALRCLLYLEGPKQRHSRNTQTQYLSAELPEVLICPTTARAGHGGDSVRSFGDTVLLRMGTCIFLIFFLPCIQEQIQRMILGEGFSPIGPRSTHSMGRTVTGSRLPAGEAEKRGGAVWHYKRSFCPCGSLRFCKTLSKAKQPSLWTTVRLPLTSPGTSRPHVFPWNWEKCASRSPNEFLTYTETRVTPFTPMEGLKNIYGNHISSSLTNFVISGGKWFHLWEFLGEQRLPPG